MKPKLEPQNWRHLLIICLAILVLSTGLVYFFLHIDLVPNSFSLERGYIDNFIKILLSIASVVFSIVIVVLVYSLIFFRRRPGDMTDGPPIKGFAPLERAWTIIPLLIVVSLAIYGAVVLDKITAPGPPQTELEVDVLAFRYGWQFAYPDYSVTSYELHVPVNQRILVKLQSKDVVHSFWVQQWGPKQDAVPGITTQVRYTPTKIGQYTVECSQLCGSGHTFMTAPALVTSQSDFQTWINQQQQKATPTPTATPSPMPMPAFSPPPTPAVTPTPSQTITATPSPPAPGASVTISLSAKNLVFDMNEINVMAGAAVTVNFNNQDVNIPHNFAVYTSQSATTQIFVGQIISGPSTIVYKFTAPVTPGNYFFRCDVHPTTMIGTLVVK